jgi:hypothetical protein
MSVSWTDDLASVVRYALATTRATAICPFHDNVTIRVGDDAAESHAYVRASKVVTRHGSMQFCTKKLVGNLPKQQMVSAPSAQLRRIVKVCRPIAIYSGNLTKPEDDWGGPDGQQNNSRRGQRGCAPNRRANNCQNLHREPS